MAFNITSIETSSSGVWEGDNPLQYAFPLLIVQTTLVLLVCRFLAFLLKPLRQPRVVAEIAGGIILGPSVLGRKKEFLQSVFPSWSTPILESAATLGLLFYLFLVGLELDLTSFRRSSRRAFYIAFAGFCLPFVLGIGLTFLVRRTMDGADRVGYGESLMFMGVSLSVTAFPVLARILAELKLLTTQVGERAMAAAAFNDIAAWIFLALAVALAGNGGGKPKSPLVSFWILVSGAAFVAFMLVVVRPVMSWVAKSSPREDRTDEASICLTLVGVMVAGFMTDLIGIHAIFGAFIFGLTIPTGGEFAGRLTKRIEDLVSGLLLPLYFASSGLKTDISRIKRMESWGMLALVISTATAGKVLGTFAVAILCRIPVRESLTLGVLMNTKGLVELIVLNIGKEKKVLNDEMFAILVMMALAATFMTTPAVMAINKPSHCGRAANRKSIATGKKENELRVLACVHGPGNSRSLINLIEATRSAAVKLYVMKLVELTERPSSILMARRARKNGFPFVDRFRGAGEAHHQVAAAFKSDSEHLGRVSVRQTTAISAMTSMHEDICHVAEVKRVAMIILPFHVQWIRKDEGDGEEVENLGHSWREVNQRVLKNAPCSVAVFVDRGFQQNPAPANAIPGRRTRVCVIFFGGADDREALRLGYRMAEHPAVMVTVKRFVLKTESPTPEKELDDAATTDFLSQWNGTAEYTKTETTANDVVEGVVAIGRSRQYELLIVGKGRFPPAVAEKLAEVEAENVELGPMGDLLGSSGKGMVPSVLVVQQHDASKVPEQICGRDAAV